MAAEILFNNYSEALKAVGSNDGIWNWVFIGPDPHSFPIIGGGAYSMFEMKQCFEQADKDVTPVLFGLLRLGFTAGTKRQTKHVFVIASDSDSGAHAAKRGIAMGHREQMEKTFAKEGHAFVCIIETHSADQINPEYFLETIKQAISVDRIDSDEGAILSLQAHMKDLEEEKARAQLAIDEAARKKAQDEAVAAEAEVAAAAAAAAAAELARRQAEGDEPCRVKVPKDPSLNAFNSDHQHKFLLSWKQCSSGHPLTLEKVGKWTPAFLLDAINCDLCAVPIEKNNFRLRCNESCDYDVCSLCFGMAYAETLSAQPVTLTSCVHGENLTVPAGHTAILAWTGVAGHEAHPEHDEPGNVQMLPPDLWSFTDATDGPSPKGELRKLCVWSSKLPDVELGARVEVVVPFDTCNEATNVLVGQGRQGVVQGKSPGGQDSHEAWLLHFDGESIFHWVWVDHLHKLKAV